MGDDPYLCEGSALGLCRAPKEQGRHEVWCTAHVVSNLMAAAVKKQSGWDVHLSTACIYYKGRSQLYKDTRDESVLRLDAGCTLEACLRSVSDKHGACLESQWPSRSPYWNQAVKQPWSEAWRVQKWQHVPASLAAVRKLLNAGVGVGFVLCMDDHTLQWMNSGGEALAELRPITSTDDTTNHAMYIQGYSEDVSFDDQPGALLCVNSNGRKHHNNTGVFFLKPSLLTHECVRDLVAVRAVEQV